VHVHHEVVDQAAVPGDGLGAYAAGGPYEVGGGELGDVAAGAPDERAFDEGPP
jgi:hypothetical protein